MVRQPADLGGYHSWAAKDGQFMSLLILTFPPGRGTPLPPPMWFLLSRVPRPSPPLHRMSLCGSSSVGAGMSPWHYVHGRAWKGGGPLGGYAGPRALPASAACLSLRACHASAKWVERRTKPRLTRCPPVPWQRRRWLAWAAESAKKVPWRRPRGARKPAKAEAAAAATAVCLAWALWLAEAPAPCSAPGSGRRLGSGCLC